MPFEKLALPHQFQPRLTVYGAVVAVSGALARVFLVSLTGALWGVGIWMAADSSHTMIWKSATIGSLATGMAMTLAAVLWAVQAVVNRFTPPHST
jgi:hypothetical protein